MPIKNVKIIKLTLYILCHMYTHSLSLNFTLINFNAILGVDLFLSIALKLMSTSLVYERSWILTLTPRRKKKLERKEKK